jgi:hypothetical protein
MNNDTAIYEVYEKYKHLDKPLSDQTMVWSISTQMRYDFWQAIKSYCETQAAEDAQQIKFEQLSLLDKLDD